VAQRQQLIAALTVVLLTAGGCGRSSAQPQAGRTGTPTYRAGQAWEEPKDWRITLTGMRCGRGPDFAPESAALDDPGRQDICLVHVAFTNDGDRARSLSDTDQPSPVWRVVGYDTQGHEFHGHARPAGITPPGASGGTELVFEVPAKLRLHRVLFGDAMIGFSGRESPEPPVRHR
jgi:hypothetical protein